MNKRDKGITEVKIAPLTLFNLSFGHVTPTFELVTRADDENSVFKYYQNSQSRRKKGFFMFLVNFGVR